MPGRFAAGDGSKKPATPDKRLMPTGLAFEEDRVRQDSRDDKGRFTRGAPPGPGRPPRRDQREFLRRLLALCTDERIDAVLMRLIADAARGDAEARKLVLGYLLGKPSASAPTPTQLAIEEESGADPLAFEIMVRKDQST